MRQGQSSSFYDFLMDDDDDDEDDQHRSTILLLLLACLAAQYSTPRPQFYVRNRLEWNAHVAELHQESPQAFRQLYRMSLQSFNKLCSWIDPHVKVDPVMSSIRTGKCAISTEIALHCLLRWLAGGSHLDIRLSAGISVTSFYACIHKCKVAILDCNHLSIDFPETQGDIDESARNFQNLSTGGIIGGCVACLDGLLLPIRTPSPDETGNVMAYFSGHYAEFGINVQAACDSFCRFVYVSVVAPGRSSDVMALRKTSLCEIIERLPLGRYVIGDNAYVCTEHLLTPFPGDQRRLPQNDTYNYHLSQLRIRIEMTFGRFMNKWRVFQRPLQMKLKNAGHIFMCAARLYNFCANENLILPVDAMVLDDNDNTQAYIPSDQAQQVEGNSMMRDILVDQIYHSGFSRPAENRRRNRG